MAVNESCYKLIIKSLNFLLQSNNIASSAKLHILVSLNSETSL